MEVRVFERIQEGLAEELQKQGYGEPVELEEEGARTVMFPSEGVAYGLRYVNARKVFELCSATMRVDGTPGEWRSLATWLFDYQTGDSSDVESILNDFIEVVQGPKQVAVMQQKRKRNKDDERVVDCLFFFNRLVTLFPELREEFNDEKIVYGQVRAVTFTKQKVVPKAEQLFTLYPNSEVAGKFCSLLDDMYKNGDLNLRSVITAVLLNGLSDGAFAAVREQVDEELQKALKYSRKLKGKKIKPEKKKKQGKKIETRLEA